MKKIIVTAVLSTILTVTGSYFVMKSQLTAEQDYWINRQGYERSIATLNKQIELVERFNNSFLKVDAFTAKLRFMSSALQAEFHVCTEAIKLGSSDYRCTEQVNNYVKAGYEYREKVYDLSVTLQILGIYFSKNVTDLVPVLIETVEKNYNEIEISLVKFDPNKMERSPAEYLNRDMNSIPDFVKMREKLITVMLKEIDESKSNLHSK